MDPAEFDRHAASYRQQHEQNISLTGEGPAYFADYKVRDFKALIASAGLSLEGRFLDFGSGIGASIEPFRRHLPKAQLACADVSAESLALSKKLHGDTVEHVWMPDGSLPVADGVFDGVFACCVFHHIEAEQHLHALTEIRRVLKPGGMLMVYEHNPFNPLTVRAVRTCPFDENAVLLSLSQTKRAARQAGFQLYKSDYRVFFPAMLARLRVMEDWLRWLPLGAQYYVALRA